MGLFDKKKICAEFHKELQKQTNPYAYYITEEETKTRGVHKEGSPLCSIKKSAEFKTCQVMEAVTAEQECYDIYCAAAGVMEPDAIERLLACTVQESPDLIYCDEDYITGESQIRHTPWMKPDWSEHTLLSFNYIGSLFAVKRSVAERIQLPFVQENVDEQVSLYDFLLRVTEICEKIWHVSEILYHNYSTDMEDTQIYEKVVSEYRQEKYAAIRSQAFERRGFEGKSDGLVSVIIPSKDHADILIRCMESIVEPAQIIIIDNGSSAAEKNKIEQYMQANPTREIVYKHEPAPFNFSAMCNQGAELARGEYLLFLNDDIEAVDTDFMEKMRYYAKMPHVGAVGARLYYPDSAVIQHVGVTNLKCGPSHKLASHTDTNVYYFGYNRFNRDVLAVTGACLMISKRKYFKVGAFSVKMEVGYNDIDLCVRLYEQGYTNVQCNDALLYHHESLSRGEDKESDSKYTRLFQERAYFYQRHAWLLEHCDPFYNRNLLQDTLDYRPNVQAEYELLDYNNEICSFEAAAMRTEKRLHFHIESVYTQRAVNAENENRICFEGWSLFLKKDNACYERYLCLIPENQKALYISVSPKYRADVKEVFQEAQNTELAGFVCRVPASYIQDDLVYRIGVLFVSKIWNRKYIMLGDYYAKGRGCFTKEV